MAKILTITGVLPGATLEAIIERQHEKRNPPNGTVITKTVRLVERDGLYLDFDGEGDEDKRDHHD